MPHLSAVIQIAIGGAFGSVARHLVNAAAGRLLGMGFPFGTLTVNVLGSFAMGALVVVLARLDATRLAPLLMTGFLGGFTTFSAFALDSVFLWERGETAHALAYAAGSVLLSLMALVLAMRLLRPVLA